MMKKFYERKLKDDYEWVKKKYPEIIKLGKGIKELLALPDQFESKPSIYISYADNLEGPWSEAVKIASPTDN